MYTTEISKIFDEQRDRESSKSCPGTFRIKGSRTLQARPHFLLSLLSLDRSGGKRVVYRNAVEANILRSPQSSEKTKILRNATPARFPVQNWRKSQFEVKVRKSSIARLEFSREKREQKGEGKVNTVNRVLVRTVSLNGFEPRCPSWREGSAPEVNVLERTPRRTSTLLLMSCSFTLDATPLSLRGRMFLLRVTCTPVLPVRMHRAAEEPKGSRADVGEIPFGESLERSRVHKWTIQLTLEGESSFRYPRKFGNCLGIDQGRRGSRRLRDS
ncbi:hypothetical protein K0M31_012498 [Melipona bicolor]|uniref:Uncharacterized protein n=1 Tax=Melipona bicolor TaxID=60889 RepID=A0AA40KHQ3_9HYME|nr:hypothetical protein K0M31_012498 [Melipona bicolor]